VYGRKNYRKQLISSSEEEELHSTTNTDITATAHDLFYAAEKCRSDS
jgi:hypothetical protein